MQDEEKQGDSYCQIQLCSLLHQILVVLGRCQEARREGHALEEAEEAMVRAARYINQHYQEGLKMCIRDSTCSAPSPSPWAITCWLTWKCWTCLLYTSRCV